MKCMKNITQPLKVIALALVLSVGISYVSAWNAPTVTPPNGNVSAPINISGTDQSKLGSISAASFIDSNDPTNFFMNPNGDSKFKNIFTTGSVGIGTTNPQQKLSVVGTIESTSGGIKFPDGTIQTTAASVNPGPSGTLCGFSDWYGGGYWQNLTACQGVIPGYSGCPAGYTTVNVAAAANHWMYSCVKN
jgi:hypothetical protein